MRTTRTICLLMSFLLINCQIPVLSYSTDDLEIVIETGSHWLHDYPLILELSKKNPPQLAIWVTDLDTNYLTTIFCTHKIARCAWQSNSGNLRKEALPFWIHCREKKFLNSDSNSTETAIPTKSHPLTDGITAASPEKGFSIKINSNYTGSGFLLFAELNHSTDFNDYYQKNSSPGTDAYSGGSEGSGQPAVLFSCELDLSRDELEVKLELSGHSSPDGNDGNLYTDMERLTTAKSIVSSITVKKH